MLSFLKKVDDETWGKYAVSREPLRNRIPETRKIEMIRGSIRCGEEYAGRILRENGNVSPREIAEQFGLSVRFSDLPMTDKRVLFAQFTPPNQIEIMQEPMKEYKTVLEGATAEDCSRLPTVEKIQIFCLDTKFFTISKTVTKKRFIPARRRYGSGIFSAFKTIQQLGVE